MLRFPPKRILVPIDLSPLSYHAFAEAAGMARRFGAQLEVLYVEPPPPLDLGLGLPVEPADLHKSLTKEIRLKIGRAPRLFLRWGDPAVAILRMARTRRPDLIVMGTHGRSGLARLALGSVAEMVVRRSPVPVLAARGKPASVEKVVAALNFTDYSDFGLTYAAAFAQGMGAELALYHATGKSEWVLRVLNDLRERARRLPPIGRKAPGILAKPGVVPASIAAMSKAGTVVAVVSHLKNDLREAVFGTTAERVMRAAKGSVLVIPAPRKSLERSLLRVLRPLEAVR